jgi:imidazolonepropionase
LQDACKNVLNEQIPELIALKKDGQISVENIDVFHEKGVYETDETRRILAAGKEAGLSINFHGDELHPMASAELGGELGARAISHLEEISDAGIKTMAKKKIFGVLLPTTAYVLRIKPPPARKMIEAGVPVALGSDFNPNAHCLSMPFVMNLACGLMRMTLNEALVASTINAAASLNRSETHGSIEVGKRADLVILDHSDWRHVIYEMVDPPIAATIINGKAVYEG